MPKRKRLTTLLGFPLIAALLFLFPSDGGAQDLPKGNVIGFLYAKDGTTPLEGAVVKFKNLTSGLIFESSRSDSYGIFKVQGIEKGIYTYGIVTDKGDFNAATLVGLKVEENETAKISIALDPYDKEAAEAISEIYKEQEKNGEALVGMIADFDPETREAKVQIVKGILQVDDRIHARGKSTNFYQDIAQLMIANNIAKRMTKGQTGTIRLEQQVQPGDLLYVVASKKIFPLFLAPLGVASIIGGNDAVTYGIIKIKDQAIPASAKKNN